jgi:integrase
MVGRKRKDGNPLGLERRVYWHHGQFRYRHATGAWEDLGTDVGAANERARALNNPASYGTIAYWLEQYITTAKAGQLPAGRTKAARSIADNEIEAEYLSASPLGKLSPQDLVRRPDLISTYRDERVVDGKGKVQANHELSLLSAMYAWLIETGKVKGLTANPVKLVKRFSLKAKERYVEDHEYRPVYGIAQRSVCMALELVYRTLQRPGDILALPPAAVRTKTVSGLATRVLTVEQSKTGRTVDIEITPALDAALHMLTPEGQQLGALRLTASVTKLVPTLVHDLAGTAYTDDGLGAMLRRYCKKAGVRSFGLMDVRAKGATDMYLDGVPLEHIQQLMGHESVQTTEINIKRMLSTVSISKPNALAIAG